MRTNRGMVKLILLSLVTCGIYGIWFWATVGEDLNILVPTGKKTMHFALFTLFSHGLHWVLFRLCGCTEFQPRQVKPSDREELITVSVPEHSGDGIYSVHL